MRTRCHRQVSVPCRLASNTTSSQGNPVRSGRRSLAIPLLHESDGTVVSGESVGVSLLVLAWVPSGGVGVGVGVSVYWELGRGLLGVGRWRGAFATSVDVAVAVSLDMAVGAYLYIGRRRRRWTTF